MMFLRVWHFIAELLGFWGSCGFIALAAYGAVTLFHDFRRAPRLPEGGKAGW